MYGFSRKREGVVHTPSGVVIDHGLRSGVYVRWLCGAGAWNPEYVEEPPQFRRLCRNCGLLSLEQSGVYFASKNGLIKIGCSAHPAKRVANLGAELIAVQPGDFETERTLHRVFADDREHGEWFRPSTFLLAYIERVIAENAEQAA